MGDQLVLCCTYTVNTWQKLKAMCVLSSKHVVDEVELLELKTEVEKWRTLYEELYSKVKPFQVSG